MIKKLFTRDEDKHPFYKTINILVWTGIILFMALIYFTNKTIVSNEKSIQDYQINMVNTGSEKTLINEKINEIKLKIIYLNDMKSIFFGIVVGLIFSFLLTIDSIRSFIIKSIANFMSDGTYLSKLNKNELVDTINSAYSQLNGGVDLASNKESLFNYIKSLDQYLITPHKSTVSESLNYKIFDIDKKLFLAERIQDFRVHTLNTKDYNKFDIIYRYYGVVEECNLKEFRDNHSIEIFVNDKPIISLKKLPSEDDGINNELKENSYNNDTKEYKIYYHKEITLENEFTEVSIISKKVETIDNSIAMANTYATYNANYKITLPVEYIIENIFHNSTLSSIDKFKQIRSRKNDNMAQISMRGWQLPGLAFVLTYKKN